MENSSNNNSPQHSPSEGETMLKTPETVLAELSGGDDGASDSDIEEGEVFKKRKNTQVKNPPSGKPICPECKKEFSTWKAAFGHMRKHPERTHRGFFPPPTFKSNYSSTNIAPEGDGDNLSEGVTSIVRELLFDLNRSIYETEAGSSTNAAPTENQEGKKTKGFDLNELPSSEDDETQDN